MSGVVPYLPLMLDCRAQPVLVVGAGKVAERKVLHMLEAGAHITVISPEATAVLQQLAVTNKLCWWQRSFETGDLSNGLSETFTDGMTANAADRPDCTSASQSNVQRYLLVYAATSLPDVNRQVAEEAKRLGIPVNVADRHELGTFINPAVIRRGRLVASVSTSGAGPAISRRIVRELEHYLDEDYELYMEFMYHLRHHIKTMVHDPQERRRLLEHAATLDVLAQIRHKQFVWWDEQQIEQWIIQYRGR
ncbi:bifunctional precorrin-2 dehydrogenase/sirohydrochlorin ferrochelatase [Paenibacillus campi]|uniref:precorrin-2 dehydrogenase/sirohydrochlorin ferrochelatase family protein n=1 Tax=Paenibacillus campi TaxID=3106031 RepID=UPI002AFEE8F3|nr:bifunctional precorrin-2 dehydrogenase/sirohydrochlorin ferrochelatase [Paenibacillus sp. SGZ-1014]